MMKRDMVVRDMIGRDMVMRGLLYPLRTQHHVTPFHVT
jgi:hypothetical protein